MRENVAALLNAGKLNAAEKLCTELCQRSAGDAEHQILLAYIKIQLQKYAEAITCGRRAVKLAPENLDACRLLGYALHSGSRFDEAIECYQKILQHNSGDAQVLNNMGNSFLAMERLDEAKECYGRALESMPRFTDAVNNMGTVLRKMGRYNDAIGKYREALKISPEYFAAYCNIGDMLLDDGDIDAAIENYRKSLQLNPGYITALHRLADALKARGDYGTALEYYRQVVGANPDNPGAWFSMGGINGKLDRHERAIFCYQKVIEHDPEFVPALTNLGALLNTLGDYDHAIDHLNRAIQIKPDNVLATFNLANAWRSKENFDKAVACYEKVLDLEPGHAEAGYQLSIIKGTSAPDKPPAEYVANLFDQYAWKFDEHLTGRLEYRTPQMLNAELRKALPPDVQGWSVLDIGCGTGLFGPFVKDIAARLVGVDLSSRMIDKAREKRVYDEFAVADVTEFLSYTESSYDLVVAADVFPYFGDLEEVFAACHSVLKAGGLFAFSVEAEEGAGNYICRQSGRYAHSINYLRSVLDSSGFEECSLNKAVLRKEKDNPIDGYLFVAKRVNSKK